MSRYARQSGEADSLMEEVALSTAFQLEDRHIGFSKIKCADISTVTVDAKDAEVIKVIAPPMQLKIKGHETVITPFATINCSATGVMFPPANSRWLKLAGPVNLQISGDGATLFVQDMDPSGRYSYMCRVQNVHGAIEKQISFDVLNVQTVVNTVDEDDRLNQYLLYCAGTFIGLMALGLLLLG